MIAAKMEAKNNKKLAVATSMPNGTKPTDVAQSKKSTRNQHPAHRINTGVSTYWQSREHMGELYNTGRH